MRDVRRRSVSSNVASNSTRKPGKYSSRGEEVSTSGANQPWVGPERRVPKGRLAEVHLHTVEVVAE